MQMKFERADILRYVQNEMSTDETKAFEAELETNQKLKEEVSFFLNMDANIAMVKEEAQKETLQDAELSSDEIVKEGYKPSTADTSPPSSAKNSLSYYVGKVLIGMVLLFGGYLAYLFIF